MPRISLQQHRKDIDTYKGEMQVYKLFAEVLRNVLQKAVDQYARDGIVQARPKSIESYSEKIIRKDKYSNPLIDMTDLCGARVIVHFESEVKSICNFIRNHFEIDEANSVDVKTRLKMTEFGYRSVHYIVTPRRPEILGITIPEEIQNKKAEIQIRTFNEHVWADILHDRIYKTKLRVPSGWQRESARLAAVLEEVDNSFKTISETLDQFSVNYRPTPDRKELENEVFILKTLIDVNKDITDKSVIQYVKLALVYNLLGAWEQIVELLEPVYKELDSLKTIETKGRVQLEYGFALGKLNQNKPADEGLKPGIDIINDALKLFNSNPKYYLEISKASYYLAMLHSASDKSSPVVSAHLLQAVKFSPENPYYLIRSIIEEISLGIDAEKSVSLFTPQLKKIIGICSEHIEMGIEVPDAYIANGLSYLLLGDNNNCALQFIELLMVLKQKNLPVSEDTIHQATALTSKISDANSPVIKGLLQLIAWKQFGSQEAENYLRTLRNKNVHFGSNVLIVAGLSGKFSQQELELYSSYIHEALFEYSGHVIMGSTISNLSGLAGKFEKLITYDTNGFSLTEVLKYWVDIIFNDLPVTNIMLLGINGDDLSEAEYKIAAALGIKTALVLETGGAAASTLDSKLWATCPNLMAVPRDPQTLWALVTHYRKSVIDADILNSFVQKVHMNYRRKRLKNFKPATTDINKLKEVMEWKYLDPNLKTSNLKQFEFMEHILRRVGLGIRKMDHPGKFRIPKDLKNKTDFDALARLEHARWNAERLLDGWKYGPVKDVNNKISDCLLPWDRLSDEIKIYDYDPVKKFPDLLGRMGYEIYSI